MAAIAKLSRDDFRKQKELDEARKAGTAPAEVDEEGKDINPHIPQYISKTPWYLGIDKPTLKHQRVPQDKIKEYAKIEDEQEKAKKIGTVTRYRKGACENCGAMTHAKKDCLERPRQLGAKFTGKAIAPDEFIPANLDYDFDGKRDRWRGYDPREHEKVIEEYEKMDLEKRRMREEELEKEQQANPGGKKKDEEESSSDDSEDNDKGDEVEEKGYAEQASMVGSKFDAKQRFTVRNLRIREDTAKYLRNLDPASAFYDPKTRTMRSNPYANTGKDPSELNYAGDNYIRYNGDVKSFSEKQLFAWDATSRGTEVHLLADPTTAEMMHKQFVAKKEVFKESQKGGILEKYGGAEYLDAPPKELLMAQTESYTEYSRSGRVVKGQAQAIVRSKYVEDSFPGNHTSVWGSFYRNGQWGFSCCHSHVRMSYCTGEAGKQANQASAVALDTLAERKAFENKPAEPVKSLLEQHRDKDSTGDKDKKKRKKGDTDNDEDTETVNKAKVKMAMKLQEEEDRRAEEILKMDDRSRPYNSGRMTAKELSQAGSFSFNKHPTEEEMEAYRIRQQRGDDPMKDFL